MEYIYSYFGNPRVVQWLGFSAFSAVGPVSIPSQGTKILKAAAAAKSLQSCPTLCDPIDSSPPGSPVPRILQVRTLEWVAISFSNARKWKVKVKSLSHVRPSATPWTAAFQAPPWDFPGKSTGVGCLCLLWTLPIWRPWLSDIPFQFSLLVV